MNKTRKILTVGSLVAIAAPIATVVACGDTTVEYDDQDKLVYADGSWSRPPEIKLDESRLLEDTWPEYQDLNWTVNAATPQQDINDLMLIHPISTRTLNSYETSNGEYHHLMAMQDGAESFPGETVGSDIYVSKFDFGTEIGVINNKSSIGYIQKPTEMEDMQDYEFATSLTAHTLTEGGTVNLDLFVEDGVIYNRTSTRWVNAGAEMTAFKNIDAQRPVISFDQDYNPSIISGVDVWGEQLTQFSLNIGGVEQQGSREVRNIPTFDAKLTQAEIMDFSSHKAKRPKANEPLAGMNEGDTRVRTGLMKESQITVADLEADNLIAYTVDATDLNGITTVDTFGSFLAANTIAQAPFTGEITSISSKGSFTSTPGTATIFQKNSTGVPTFQVGDAAIAGYEFNDNPINQNNVDAVSKIKDSKISFSSVDFGGNRANNIVATDSTVIYDQYISDNNIYSYTATPGTHYMGNASHVIQDGSVYAFAAQAWTSDIWPSTDDVARQYFVIYEDNTWGYVTFAPNAYTDHSLHFYNLPQILKMMGAKEAVSMDGGGSAQQFIQTKDGWMGNPNSVDIEVERKMTLALGVALKEEDTNEVEIQE